MDDKDKEFHMRMHALKLAVEHNNVFGDDIAITAVLETAKQYYNFLKGDTK